MPTVQDLVNLLAMQDQQQGAANARMNPSTYGFGGVAPDPRAAGLAALPAAFSPAEMSQWDQQQGFHSEMAGGRPMWVAPGTPQADTGMTYAQWQRTQPTSRFGGYSIENGSPTETKVSIPLSGKAAESRDLVAGNAAAARLGVAMDAAKKKSERETAAKSRAVVAATDPVSQRARANQTRRQTGMPMDQALARQQMLGWGDGQINPMQAEIAMPGTGGKIATGMQANENERRRIDAEGKYGKPISPAEKAAGLIAIADSEPDPSRKRELRRQAEAIIMGGSPEPQSTAGGFQPTPVSGPGAAQNPYDPYNPDEKDKYTNWNAEQSGSLTEGLIDEYDKLYNKATLGLDVRASQAMGLYNPTNREKIISTMVAMTGKPRAAIEKWYELRFPARQPSPSIPASPGTPAIPAETPFTRPLGVG